MPGRMLSFRELADVFSVEFTVDGNRHIASVEKNSFTIRAAGVCLTGRDREFDLASLVGVLREGERRGRIYRVGDNRWGVNYGDDQERDGW